MEEMFKNKFMLIFATLVLGITFVYSTNSKKMEENVVNDTKDYIVMNIK